MDDLIKLQLMLKQAGEALKAVDGELVNVKFNSRDKNSIEAAIVEVEKNIDAKLKAYNGNTIIDSLACEIKAKCRDNIIIQANNANLDEDNNVN